MKEIFVPVTALGNLSDGDLVLHDRFGLARFEGTRSTMQNQIVVLRFAEEIVYWEPAHRIDNLQKYVGRMIPLPALDKPGRASANRTRLRLLNFQDEPAVKLKAAQSRSAIRESVRHEVWRWDQGRCVRCGSREKLEFDHIVPFSKGGSDTARNVELLCETCNRAKGARI